MIPKVGTFIFGVVCISVGLGGCASHATHVAKPRTDYTSNDLQWLDRRTASAASLRPLLDRAAIQEGGDWSGPYTQRELEDRLPEPLKSAEFRSWISSFYSPAKLDYYVISKIGPNSYRDAGGMVDTIGRFPVCVIVVNVAANGAYYRRYVFNETGGNRNIE